MAKIQGTELDSLRNVLSPLDTLSNRDAYRNGNFPRASLVQDLNKRYRWDIFYAARGYTALANEYMDSHIYTALKTIIPDL